LAYFVVATAGGLPPPDRVRAVESGPDFVETGTGYSSLMNDAGFVGVTTVDVTADYATTLSQSITARDAERSPLERLIGADRFAEGQASRRQELEAVYAGILRRFLITATTAR
jgi:hypothetical protein